MVITPLARWFGSRHRGGPGLPDDYFTADTETSGLSRDDDLILEWGHTIVHGRKVVDKMSLLINWYAHPDTDARLLDAKLDDIRRAMRSRGRPWHLTPARLQNEGVPPDEALPWLWDLLGEVRDSGLLFVTHNGLFFDLEILNSTFRRFLHATPGPDGRAPRLEFPPDQVFDTGCVEKAAQLVHKDLRALPRDDESLRDYFRRIYRWRAPGVYWNLDTHCVRKYGLDVSAAGLHAADADAYALHLLMEKYRELFLATDITPPRRDGVPVVQPVARPAAQPVAQPAAQPVAIPPRRAALDGPSGQARRPRTPPPASLGREADERDPLEAAASDAASRELHQEMTAFFDASLRAGAPRPSSRFRGQRNR